jgi:peroxiredoxin Q/BCP
MNKPAPDFTLLDQDGKPRSLSNYSDRWLVVFFYPKDNSVNCTKEACAFRDEHQIIAQFGNADVIGINKGSVASHKKFAEKNHFNFPLLSDPRHEVTKAYGAWKSNKPGNLIDKTFGTRRNTYLIDPGGMIVKEYKAVDPVGHVEQIIQDLQNLQKLA